MWGSNSRAVLLCIGLDLHIVFILYKLLVWIPFLLRAAESRAKEAVCVYGRVSVRLRVLLDVGFEFKDYAYVYRS